MNRGLWNLSVIMVLLGIAGIGAGQFLLMRIRRKEELTGHTVAKVVKHVLRKSKGKAAAMGYENRYYPVLEYYADGKLIKVIHKRTVIPGQMQVGTKVPIDYDPDHPEKYAVVSTDKEKVLSYGLYTGGAVMLVMGILAFLRFAVRG